MLLHTRSLLYLLLSSALYLSGSSLPALSQVTFFNSPIDTLPVLERVSLGQGRPVVTGENGTIPLASCSTLPVHRLGLFSLYRIFDHRLKDLRALSFGLLKGV